MHRVLEYGIQAAFAHFLGTPKTASQVQQEVGGSTRQLFACGTAVSVSQFLVLLESDRALLRSPSGPGAGSFLSVSPTNRMVPFRFADFHSVSVAPPLSPHPVVQGSWGDGGLLWKVWRPGVCREAGARVTTRDPDLPCPMQPETVDVWKSWPTRSLCPAACNWPLFSTLLLPTPQQRHCGVWRRA